MKKLIISTLLALAGASSFAATGEMGTGVPGRMAFLNSIVHGANVTVIYPLVDQNPATPFPAGCSTIWINQSSIGADQYKMYTSILISARMAGQRVRLFASINHPTGGNAGCEADYIELN